MVPISALNHKIILFKAMTTFKLNIICRSVSIINMSGTEAYQAETGPEDGLIEISAYGWSPGLYFVRIQYNGYTKVVRILK